MKKLFVLLVALALVGAIVYSVMWYRKKQAGSSTPPAALSREQQIRVLYQSVLGREADPSGLAYYLNGPLTLEQIKTDFLNSAEYRATQTKPAGITIVPGSNMDSSVMQTTRPDLWAQKPVDWSDVGYLTNHRDVYDWLKAGANSSPLEHYIVAGKQAGYTYK